MIHWQSDLDAILTALVPGIITALVALLAWLTATARRNTWRLDQHEKVLNGSLSHPSPPVTMVPDPRTASKTGVLAGSGASTTTAVPSQPITTPGWSQRDDPNPDGRPDSQSLTDCGEECVSIVARITRGIEVSEGYIRYLLGGPDRVGYTTAQDLTWILRRWYFHPVTVTLEASAIIPYLTTAMQARRPIIALGHFVTPTDLHWVVVTGIITGKVAYTDPWDGTHKTLDVADFELSYQGVLVDPGEPAIYAS